MMLMVKEQMSFQMEKVKENGKSEKTQLPKRFPFRLNKMLNDAEAHGNDHIVSWMPDGKMFKVHKHKEFAASVMPLYCRHTRYKSFLRQLSMYKFQRVNEGPLRGCYHHPNFARDRFDLIDKINRKDRGDEDSSVSCSSAPLMTLSRKTLSDFRPDQNSLDVFLSESDAETALTDDNDFESIKKISAQDASIATSNNERKIEKRIQETRKETLPKTATESGSSICATAVRKNDPFFDSVRKIGCPTGLFDLREDFSTKSPAPPTTASVIVQPMSVGSHHPNNRSSVGEAIQVSSNIAELMQPHHPGDSCDILDEIIKTFTSKPSDP